MRLINVTEYTLKEFWGKDVPPYAILSHTWGDVKEEVIFSDIDSGKSFMGKDGWPKIQYLCEEAARRCLSWVWCDTCCINKDSSAELSEAINSMYRWYQQAQVCFVYLSDVGEGIDATVPLHDFTTSYWFTRGWTLQELLAPEFVEFYSREWAFIGARQQHAKIISCATRIDWEALLWPWTIGSYSIATRMAWASRRSTTRVEDAAYSMLGLLGIHMPLLYGEGRNAFQRLLIEVIKSSTDETFLAHGGLNLLADGPEDYVDASNLVFDSDYMDPQTHQISNKGLHIHMKIAEYKDSSGYHYGFLNSHHRSDPERVPIIRLRKQGSASVFTFVPSVSTSVCKSQVDPIPVSKILILLKPPSLSRLECCLILDWCWPFERPFSLHTSGASRVFQPDTNNRATVFLDPRKDVGFEVLEYRFEDTDKSGGFSLYVIFDFCTKAAGVLLGPLLYREREQYYDVYDQWDQGGRLQRASADTALLMEENKIVTGRFDVSISTEWLMPRALCTIRMGVQSFQQDSYLQ